MMRSVFPSSVRRATSVLSRHRHKEAAKASGNICPKLSILGGGQMCEAILGALQVKGVQCSQNITVFDLNEKRLQLLSEKYGVNTSNSAQDAVDNAEIAIIAVKPHNVAALASALTTPSETLVLSIVAGMPVRDLKRLFRTDKVIRSMPNTPAMVLEGVTVWIPTPETPLNLINKARTLLSSFGDQVEVTEEHYLDMATAVSGSGPAYVFLTMEAMIDAAVHMGFPRHMASKLVIATIKGSAAYAEQSDDHIAKLRNSVTSPGGTTASALYELDRGGFRTVVADAIWAAYRRSLELGGNDPNVGPGRSQFKGKN